MLKKRSLLLLFLLSINFTAFSQNIRSGDGEAYSLKEVLKIGLENSYDIKKSRLDENAAAYQRKEIVGTGLPQLKAYGNYNNFLNVSPMGIPGGVLNPETNPNDIDVIQFGVPQSLQAGFQLNQLIFSQSYLVGLKAAKTSEEFYLLLTQMNKEDILYDLAMNYYNIIGLELQRENLDANMDRLLNLEKILKAQFENDLAKKVDYNRVKVNLTTLEASKDDLEIGISQSKNYLKLLMGVPMNTPLELQQQDFDFDLAGILPAHLYGNLQNRVDLQVLNKQQDLYGLDIKNIQAGYYPSLIGFADVNYNTFANEFNFLSQSKPWYRGALIGLKLEIPIFDGFQRKNRVAQAKVRSMQLEQDIMKANQAAEMEHQNGVKKLTSSVNSAKAQEENLRLAEEVYGQTELLYKEGLSPLTDLLEAETALREARTAYNNQIINVKTAQVDLYKSRGEISKMAD
ncbi:TolC family protein [Cyclobacterium sp.]|uniref:TolC family protein n=1 Tax=Cyclobacterium sp. TaxID=1966343 RepID=UPI0019C02CE7|nr:TolC family protein [Cyclobacterium sp.]MBD3631287.1 TolC family protein [Cyclobacterium sp.]